MSIAYRAIEAKIDREWGVITALSKYYEIIVTSVCKVKTIFSSSPTTLTTIHLK
jgi:hypothetical protein